MTLQHLYDLDRSSSQFPDQLDHFLHHEENVKYTRNLPEDELVGLVNYLDDALSQLDHTSQSFRKCSQVLQELCGSRGVLPTSYRMPESFSSMSDKPVAFGGFSDVFKGEIGVGVEVCVKKIRICSNSDMGALRRAFCKEAAVWKHLRHPNVVLFKGVKLNPLQLVSEWMPRGELREYMGKNPGASPIKLLIGIAEGLTYLHSCNVVHGDLKGLNIMIDRFGNPRITDFGLATIVRNPHSNRSTLDSDEHTARWCAPEVLRGERLASKESDMFSFGMVMIEVFTGRAPFGDCRTPVVIMNLMTGKTPERPNHAGFTDKLWGLTRWCWKQEPLDRPRADQVLTALRDVDGSGGAPPNKNGILSGASPSLPRLITGSPLLRKRRNAEKHHTITVTSTTTASTSASQSGDESDPVLDSVRGTKLGGKRLAYFPAVGPRTLPHPPKRSNEKVSPCWHSRDGPVHIPAPIQPQPQHRPQSEPQPLTVKKHGLWCRIKRSLCCGQLAFSSISLAT